MTEQSKRQMMGWVEKIHAENEARKMIIATFIDHFDGVPGDILTLCRRHKIDLFEGEEELGSFEDPEDDVQSFIYVEGCVTYPDGADAKELQRRVFEEGLIGIIMEMGMRFAGTTKLVGAP